MPAFAKVNFTLDVLGLMPDGYHSVATVMQAISLCDTVRLTETAGRGVTLDCSDPSLPQGEDNLAVRAARMLVDARSVGLNIELTKVIPSQAGLGGGSSDAAAVLRGVNELFNLGLTTVQLSEKAAALGSDVAFFLHGGTAVCRGRGEVITELADSPALWFVIVKPDIGISTPWAYRELDAIPDRVSHRGTRRMEQALADGDAKEIMARMSNDFERVVAQEHLPIMLLMDDLMMARCRNVRLCGSGSAVFGVTDNEREAKESLRMAKLKYPDAILAQCVGREQSICIQEESH